MRGVHAGCDGCAEHVPDHCVPWNLEASGYRWRFCSVECLAAWILREQLEADQVAVGDSAAHDAA